jgi:hypothetical protein
MHVHETRGDIGTVRLGLVWLNPNDPTILDLDASR